MGVLEFAYGSLDGGFLVGGNLVAEFGELFLGLEDYSVGLVEFVDFLFLFGVGGGVGGSFILNAFDFVKAPSRCRSAATGDLLCL